MIKAVFLLYAAITTVANCAALPNSASESDDNLERANNPSPRAMPQFYNYRGKSPVQLLRTASDEPKLVTANYPTHFYDSRSFLPLEFNKNEVVSVEKEKEEDKLQIENNVRRFLKKLNIEDEGMVSKVLSTFFLALFFLLIYNGFFLN